MNELENNLLNFSCYKFEQEKQLLIVQTEANNYLIIKQLVEISEILRNNNIEHIVYENNDIQLYLD